MEQLQLTGQRVVHAHALGEVAVYDADGTELANTPAALDAPAPDA